jgi:hypothetical protein
MPCRPVLRDANKVATPMSDKPSTFQTPITELLQMFGLQINPGKEFFRPNSMVLEEGLCDWSARLGRSIVLQSVLERKEAGSTADINQIPISIDSL